MRRLSLMLLLVGLMGAVMLAAGCGGDSTSSTDTAKAGIENLIDITPPGPNEVDKVTWNLQYDPASIDPLKTFNYAENTACANLVENLNRLKPDLTIEPGLAESVSNPSPLKWVFSIRQGVTFWDGKPMTADDVVYSLRRNMDLDAGSYFAFYYKNVKKIEKTGDYEVTVTLKRPDVLFNEAMATPAGAVVEKAHCEATGADFGTPKGAVMGTGPFKFVSWRSGTSMTLARNDSYWDPALRPKVKTLEFSFIADESTAANALRSGDIDGMYYYLPPSALNSLQTAPACKVYYGPSLVFWSLLTAATDGPYADPRVRQALLLATDRDAIAKVVFQGTAYPARVITPPSAWSYAKDIFQAAYDAIPAPAVDLEAARRLVEEAGAKGKTITLAAQGNSVVHSQTADILKANAAQLGLNVEIKIIPVQRYGTLYWDKKSREGIDGFLSTWYLNVGDPLDNYVQIGPGTDENYIGWDPPEAEPS